MIKSVIKQNVFLYKLWFHLYRKNRGVKISFFDPETTLYVDGYPRSGNTFLVHLTKMIFPEISMVHHFHAIAPIKVALARKIATYILVREASEAVASNYLKEFSMSRGGVPALTDKCLLKDMLIEYCVYYEFVQKNKEAITLVDFVEVKQDFLPTLHDINQRFSAHLDDGVLSGRVLEERLAFQGAVDTLGASTPNPVKENLKKPLKEAIRNLPNYSIATDLYTALTEK